MSEIQVKCPQCGSDQFEFPAGYSESANSRFTCIRCGKVLTNDQATRIAGKQGLKMVTDALRKAFK